MKRTASPTLLSLVALVAMTTLVGCSKPAPTDPAPVTRNIVMSVAASAVVPGQPCLTTCSTFTYKLGTSSDTNVGSVDISNWSTSGAVGIGLPLSINLGFDASLVLNPAYANTKVTVSTTNNGNAVAAMSTTHNLATGGPVITLTGAVE